MTVQAYRASRSALSAPLRIILPICASESFLAGVSRGRCELTVSGRGSVLLAVERVRRFAIEEAIHSEASDGYRMNSNELGHRVIGCWRGQVTRNSLTSTGAGADDWRHVERSFEPKLAVWSFYRLTSETDAEVIAAASLAELNHEIQRCVMGYESGGTSQEALDLELAPVDSRSLVLVADIE